MSDKVVVISQPMFIPWVGLFEQIRLADVFVHYDDVQLPLGRSYMNRVQLKAVNGLMWLTAPLDHKRSGDLINEVFLRPGIEWKKMHLASIRHALGKAEYGKQALDLADELYAIPYDNLAEFNILCIESVARRLGLEKSFLRSSALRIKGASTQRLLEICLSLGAQRYLTGLGAYNYLDHSMFEQKGIDVHYMHYARTPYPQLHGDFIPYVTILDVIANCGSKTKDLLTSGTVDWKDYVPEKRR